MRVRDIMSTNVITINKDILVDDAKKIMEAYKIRRLPVMKKDRLIGLVTKHMMVKAEPSPATSLSIHELRYLLAEMTVKEIMVKNPFTVSPDMPVEEALHLGEEKRHGAFPVVENGKMIGIITESDVVKLVSKIVKVQDEVKGVDIKADKEFENIENKIKNIGSGLENDIAGPIAEKHAPSGFDGRYVG